MSESLVTQCPYCQTRFRLSQEQLSAAGGNVRCGACLKVFNAITLGSLHSAAAADSDFDAEENRAKTTDPRDGTLLIHDDLDFDELDLEALGMDDSLIQEVNPTAMDEALPDPVIPDATTLEFDIDPDEELEPELFIEFDPEIPLEPEDEPEDGSEKEPSDLETEPYLDLHDDFITTPIQDFGPPAVTERDEELDSQAPFAIPQKGTPLRPLNAGDDPDEGSQPGRNSKLEYVTPKLAWRAPEDPAPEPEPLAPPPAPKVKFLPEPDPEPEPDLGELDIPDLHEEPILLTAPPLSARRRQRTWLWGTLSVLAAITLVAQYVTYNRDFLVHDQRTRPMAETFCLLAGCELPARVDISLMRSSNLMVRNHPEFPNALAIDVILYNRADFAQPFPVLRMSFTDPQGRELSSRRFRPEEYLSGELAGASLMPRQTPIHVGLSMLDPGEQAVSYTLEFQSP